MKIVVTDMDGDILVDGSIRLVPTLLDHRLVASRSPRFPGHSAASNGLTYSIEGTAAVSPSPVNYCTDVYGCPMSDSGTPTLFPPHPIHPATGTFSVRWTITTFPPNPCKVKRLDGTLDVAWSDGTTSTATVGGKFVDGKSILKFSEAVGATATSFAGYTVAGVFNGHPPSPCITATSSITGGLTFYPPGPI